VRLKHFWNNAKSRCLYFVRNFAGCVRKVAPIEDIRSPTDESLWPFLRWTSSGQQVGIGNYLEDWAERKKRFWFATEEH